MILIGASRQISFLLIVIVIVVAVLTQSLSPGWISLPITLLGILAAFVVPRLWGQVQTTFGRRKLLYQGVRLTMKGRYNEAIEAISSHLKQRPDDDLARLFLAGALTEADRGEEALATLDRVRSTRFDAEVHLGRGQVLAHAGASEEGRAEIEKALARKPRIMFGRGMLAPHLIDLRLLETAISLLKKERVNNSARALHRAEAYRLLGRPDLARKNYRKAEKLAKLEVRVGFLTSRANHAYVLAAQGDLFDAEREVQRTLEDWPACRIAIYTQALIERRRGDAGGVEHTLQRMLSVSPHQVVCALTDPDFTPLLTEQRFRRLLAWALGARRANIERLRNRPGAAAPNF